MKEKLFKNKRKRKPGVLGMVVLLLLGMAAGSLGWSVQKAEVMASEEMIQVFDISVIAREDGICAGCIYSNFNNSVCTVQLYLEKQNGTEAIPVVYRNLSDAGEEEQKAETEVCQEGAGIYRAVLLTRVQGETTVVRFQDSGWYEAVDMGDYYEVRPYVPGSGESTDSGKEEPGQEPEEEPGQEPEEESGQEPEEEPGQESEEESGQESEEEPGQESEEEPGQEPEKELGQEPEEPEENTVSGRAGEEPKENAGNACEHKPVRELYEPATPQRDAVYCESCELCGQVLAYGEIPNTAYVAFLDYAASIIYGAQPEDQVVITTDRWISFDERVLNAMSERADVSILIQYRDQGEEHQILLPAGADVSSLGDENGFCGFCYLSQIF